jgi:hypothetical protein
MTLHAYALRHQGATGDFHFFGTLVLCPTFVDDDVSAVGLACSVRDAAAN